MSAKKAPAGSSGSLRLDLERDVRAPATARTAVSAQLGTAGVDASLSQTIVLLVSEVVSNAVRHSDAPAELSISMEVTITAGRVRVAVNDGGGGFTPRRRDPERLGDGYGLYLLEKAASRWGVEHDGGTLVWFELDRKRDPRRS